MVRTESEMLLPHEQQIPRGHRRLEDYPGTQIAQQTHVLLNLIKDGRLRNPRSAKDFLEGETFDYLKAAQNGSLSLFNWRGILFEDVDLTIGDAAHHAFVVFAAIPDNPPPFQSERDKILWRSKFEVPKTRDDFLWRLRELRVEVGKMAEGRVKPGTPFSDEPPLFRTFGFFKVASELPLS